jgi:hypothetical protein
MCEHGTCRVRIDGTPRDPVNHARRIAAEIRKCGCSPLRTSLEGAPRDWHANARDAAILVDAVELYLDATGLDLKFELKMAESDDDDASIAFHEAEDADNEARARRREADRLLTQIADAPWFRANGEIWELAEAAKMLVRGASIGALALPDQVPDPRDREALRAWRSAQNGLRRIGEVGPGEV